MEITRDKLAYSVPEAAKLMSIGRTTLYVLTRSGAIPSVRVGEKRVLIPADAIREWLNDSAAKTEM